MGALFLLFVLLIAFAVIYPAFMAVLWLIARYYGSREKFRDFIDF